jgi:hypothetical protein
MSAGPEWPTNKSSSEPVVGLEELNCPSTTWPLLTVIVLTRTCHGDAITLQGAEQTFPTALGQLLRKTAEGAATPLLGRPSISPETVPGGSPGPPLKKKSKSRALAVLVAPALDTTAQMAASKRNNFMALNQIAAATSICALRFVSPPLTNLRAIFASCASRADRARRGRWRREGVPWAMALHFASSIPTNCWEGRHFHLPSQVD